MSKYILKYGRDARVKYISHLDFMRMFHRAVRRSGIPFEFSQGFNPHPIMTVAMPLSVGVTSECEYMKVGFDKEITDADIEHLNDVLPDGFFISDWCRYESGLPDISKLDRAEYEVEVETEKNEISDFGELLSFETLTVMKKTKSGVKPSDIRPYIYSLKEEGRDGNIVRLKMCLACGSVYNLKPETVILAAEEYMKEFKSTFISVHRKHIFAGDKEIL